MIMNKGRGLRACATGLFFTGALVACGAKSTPAKSSDATTSAAASGAPQSWSDLCKMAQERNQKCGYQNSKVPECDKVARCATDVYDPSAIAVIAKCFTDSDCKTRCDADKIAMASPSPAGKALLAATAEPAKKCPFLTPESYGPGPLFPLFNQQTLAPFMECAKKTDCSEAGQCMSMATMNQMSALLPCQEDLGLMNQGQFEPDTTPKSTTTVYGTQMEHPDEEFHNGAQMMGHPAPEISVTAVGKQKPATLKALKGKPVALVFFTTSCEKCKGALTAMDGLETKLKSKGFAVVGISVDDDQSKVQPFIAQLGVKIPIMWDSQKATAKTFHLFEMPETILVDKKGNVYQLMSSSSLDDELVAQVNSML